MERWLPALDHLRSSDDRWHPIFERIGPCLLKPQRGRFGTLVRAIVGQQISTAAARSIDGRVRAAVGGTYSPAALIALGETDLRACGLSGVKARYILNLSEAVESGQLPLHRIGRFADDEIKRMLTEIKGIGPWTAEMFLIFSLNRPDVVSPGDLGIRVALKAFHGLDEVPKPAHCAELTEAWRPFRSVAMWYLWRTIDPVKPPAK